MKIFKVDNYYHHKDEMAVFWIPLGFLPRVFIKRHTQWPKATSHWIEAETKEEAIAIAECHGIAYRMGRTVRRRVAWEPSIGPGRGTHIWGEDESGNLVARIQGADLMRIGS